MLWKMLVWYPNVTADGVCRIGEVSVLDYHMISYRYTCRSVSLYIYLYISSI